MTVMLNALKRRTIELVTKIYDPIVNLQIGNQNIKIPLSHHLREIIKKFPEYNFNIARIVNYTHSHVKNLKIIDIGANIGDTVAYIKNYTDVPILSIDGEKKYMQLFQENTKKFNNVFSCVTLVGPETNDANLKLVAKNGTASLEKGRTSVPMKTLENILQQFPDFNDSKIIKTDTDGFDTLILRSCVWYMKSVKPILFFEFDPYLIKKQNDDPFDFMIFLISNGYKYFIFYVNNGDFLLSFSSDEKTNINQVIHYFSGRNSELYADVCAFCESDRHIYQDIITKELAHFQNIRNY
jgi:FkbM family methyltransferase